MSSSCPRCVPCVFLCPHWKTMYKIGLPQSHQNYIKIFHVSITIHNVNLETCKDDIVEFNAIFVVPNDRRDRGAMKYLFLFHVPYHYALPAVIKILHFSIYGNDYPMLEECVYKLNIELRNVKYFKYNETWTNIQCNSYARFWGFYVCLENVMFFSIHMVHLFEIHMLTLHFSM